MGHSVSCVARGGVVVHEEGERWDTVGHWELQGTRGSCGSRGGRAMGHSGSCRARGGAVVHKEGERWDTAGAIGARGFVVHKEGTVGGTRRQSYWDTRRERRDAAGAV